MYCFIPLGFINYPPMVSLSLQLKTCENVVPPEEPMVLRCYCAVDFPPPLLCVIRLHSPFLALKPQ